MIRRSHIIKYIVIIMAICLLFAACKTGPAVNGTTVDSPTSGEQTNITPSPNMLEFNYGRLSMEKRFARLMGNGIDFTLNFNKKIITPGDDIVLTVYVANYTGDELQLKLNEPIVSRQQLIHASLTYGDGQYSVPVTVAYEEEEDMAGGVYDVNIRNRKLISTTVTFHTSVYENIEQSIFHSDFADTYELKFWFGENSAAYCAEAELLYKEIDWTSAEDLQSLVLPESYVRLVDDLRFTLTFDKIHCGTDDDVKMHVKIENLGDTPVGLYSNFDISDPAYYIRAVLTYGGSIAVRDNVPSPSEIAGIESQYQLLGDESIERDIVFYTSEFQAIKRSVYYQVNHGQCELKVQLLTAGEICEISVPFAHGDYINYHYQNREAPPIPSQTPNLTETTTAASETIMSVSETTTVPPETTTTPQETTTTPQETTTIPQETTTTPPETTITPQETTTTPQETTTTPQETTTTPQETTTLPAETTEVPAESSATVSDTTITVSETTTTSPETVSTSVATTSEPPVTTTSPDEGVIVPAVTTAPTPVTIGPPPEILSP